MITSMKQRAGIKRAAKDLNDRVGLRAMTPAEQDEFNDYITELDEHEERLQNSVPSAGYVIGEDGFAHKAPGSAGTGGYRARFYTNDSDVYHDPHQNPQSPSYFRDLFNAQRGSADAADRLRINNQQVGASESRALGSNVTGAASEFAPPAWLTQAFVALARPGRVTADRFHHEALPSGVSSVNLPKIATGTSAAVQATQNSSLSQTDLSSAALSSGIVTIGGTQIVSQQLLDQAQGFDQVVLQDLAADWAKQVGVQAISGTGANGQLRGYLTPSSTNIQTWTQASPTAALFYSQLAKLQGAINASRYASPDTVIMHPRRWAWFASFTDSTGRPLVVPSAGGFNSMANPGNSVAAGHVGSVLGMDVYTDPNISTTTNTSQDTVMMCKADDIWLWESDLRAEAFTAPHADTLGVLLRVFNYAALIPDRYLASLGQLTGTGLTTPVFAG